MSSVKKNFGYNVVYQVLLIIIPLITTPYLSRTLGAAGVGAYSYTFSIASYFALIAMLGIKNYGNRAVASCSEDRNKISKEFWSIYFVQLISSIIVLLAYILYVIIYPSQFVLVDKVAIIYQVATIFDISWLFFGLEKFKVTVTRSIIIKIVSTLLIFVFVKQQEDVWIYMLIMTGSALASNLVLWKMLPNYVGKVKVTREDIFKHIKPIFVLFIPTIAISLYHVMDKIMLGLLSNMVQTGYYENCEKIINLPYSFITALGTVMLPRMSHLIAHGKIDEGKKYIANTMEFIFLLGSALTFGIASISPHLVPVFMSEEFTPCIELLTLLAPLIMIKAWANVIRTQYLLPRKKDKQYVESVILGAIVNLIINYFLIPRVGATGAIIGTLVAEFTVGFYQTMSVRSELEIFNYIKNNVWFICAGALMYVAVFFVVRSTQPTILNIVLDICVGAVVYMMLSFIILIIKDDKVILPEFYSLVNRIVQKKK